MNKKMGVAAAIIGIIAVAGVIGIPPVIRSLNYGEALKAFDAEQYDKAAETLEKLGDYKESPKYLAYCSLKQAAVKEDWESVASYAADLKDFLNAADYASLAKGYDLRKDGDLSGAITCVRAINDLPEAEAADADFTSEYTDVMKEIVEQAVSEENWDQAFEEAETALTYIEDKTLSELKQRSWESIEDRDYHQALECIRREEYDEATKLLQPLDSSYEDGAELLKHLTSGEEGCVYAKALLFTSDDPYEMAAVYEAAGEYEDAAEKAAAFTEEGKSRDYKAAEAYLEVGDWEQARNAFEALEDYQESAALVTVAENGEKEDAYQAAVRLMESGSYSEAAAQLEALGTYKDSAVKLILCRDELKNLKYTQAVALYEIGDVDADFGSSTDADSALSVGKR